MKRFLPASLVALVAVLTVIGCATPGAAALRVHSTAVRLVMDDGLCSGTVIGPGAILSATHCFVGAHALSINGSPVAVLDSISDGNDHTIVFVSKHFSDFAMPGSAPVQTEEVFIYGNPGGLSDIYRVGHVAGVTVQRNIALTLYDLNGYFGDSGSGIFDASGKLVGVISLVVSMEQDGTQAKFMASLPLAFSAADWKRAQSQEGQPRA